MKESKESLEIGLTSSDIQKILDGEKLLCHKNEDLEIWVKSWTKPNTIKIVKK